MKNSNPEKTLLIGIGNSGRSDDGLGWAFADHLQGDPCLEVIYRYQLQVEDAELISKYPDVWFVDASHKPSPIGFTCERIRGAGHFPYTTHALHPEAVVQLCQEVFGKSPRARLLGISGEAFELGHGLSTTARERLDKALKYFLSIRETSPVRSG